MQIIGLTKENVNDYEDFLTKDIAEYIGREFTCGFVVARDDEDKPTAGIVWELRRGDDELDSNSRILFIKAHDEESAKVLLDEYTESAVLVECSKSSFSLPSSLGSVEKSALEKAGFSLEEKESSVFCITLADIGMALFKYGNETDARIKPLREAEDRFFDSMIAGLDMDGYRGNCEDLPFLPREYFDNDVSCYYEDNEEVYAVTLIHMKPSGKAELALLYSLDDDPENLIRVMKQAVIYADDKYDPATKLLVDRYDDRIRELSEEYFPKAKGITVFEGIRMEELPEREEIDIRYYNEEEWDDDFEEY